MIYFFHFDQNHAKDIIKKKKKEKKKEKKVKYFRKCNVKKYYNKGEF